MRKGILLSALKVLTGGVKGPFGTGITRIITKISRQSVTSKSLTGVNCESFPCNWHEATARTVAKFNIVRG